MTDPDTTMGGRAERFPVTSHSVISSLASEDPAERTRAFDALVRGYWKPVYKYLRFHWRADNEDAKDLTQEFLVRCLEKGLLDAYDPAKARFRTFLRVCLDGFVANERKSAARLKRGGGARHVPLDTEGAEQELALAGLTGAADIDAWFDQEWLRTFFAEGVARLEQWCSARGKESHFALFRRLDLDGPARGERISYADLAREFSLSTSQVTNFLALARREFRRIVLELLRESCASEEEFRREAREVLGTDIE